MAADSGRGSFAEKVIRNKPAWVKDACWEGNGTKHEETFTRSGPTTCNTLFPIYSTVRIQAGSADAGDVLKCRLKDVDFRDYAVAFSEPQQARLRAIFATGVCDWTKRGVMQKPIAGVWRDYSSVVDDRDDEGDHD
ncbi:MAG: DUF6351 family protein [Myxococcales bacterium]|nr:DUF6351 family protein [Myxococcales bacterium]